MPSQPDQGPLGASYTGSDFYCDVALRNIERLKVVIQTPTVLAYHHTRHHWPVHIVVVPKDHVASFTTLTRAQEALIRDLLEVIQRIARRVESDHGKATILTNLGAYQESKHLHVQVISGREAR